MIKIRNHPFKTSAIWLFSVITILVGCKEKDSIKIDIASKEVSGYGDTVFVQVQSNTSWYATSDKMWATPFPISSKENETVKIAIAPNSTGVKDKAVVSFKTSEAVAKLTIYRGESSIIAYKIGAFYPNDVNPIGIVFEITGQGTHGKIISLDEEQDIAWGYITPTYATHIDNGIMNWQRIKSINPTLEKFPAFAWCNNREPKERTWYLPAYGELVSISENINTINLSLQKIPTAAPLGVNVIYWSSTESVAISERVYAISLSSSMMYERDKTSLCAVRAISSF